jgi:hypothetical protein
MKLEYCLTAAAFGAFAFAIVFHDYSNQSAPVVSAADRPAATSTSSSQTAAGRPFIPVAVSWPRDCAEDIDSPKELDGWVIHTFGCTDREFVISERRTPK